MNNVLYMIWAFIVGLTLGAIFFGGLWLTVKKAVTAKIPALWFFGSFFLRVGITLIGFYYISAGNLKSLLVCGLGFFASRIIVMRLTNSIDKKQIQIKKELNNET